MEMNKGELTDSFLSHLQPSNSVSFGLWRYNNGRCQCNHGHDDGTSSRVANMVAKKPYSNSNLYNIGPKFINLSHSSHNNFNLFPIISNQGTCWWAREE